MDLLQTVRKEGSRGGRADFKWEDVKADTHRENYLGHSLMAPVGRWQKGRDLNWYAKADEDGEKTAAEKLAEEKRRLKEAEEDAMLAAMGLPVPDRGSKNANLTPLGQKASEADVKKAIAEAAEDDSEPDRGRSAAFGGFTGKSGPAAEGDADVLEGQNWEKSSGRKEREQDRPRHEVAVRRDREDHGRRRHRRSRSRSRDQHQRHRDRSRAREHRRHREHGRHRERSRSHDRRHQDDRHRSNKAKYHEKERRRSRSRDRARRSRSRSPYHKYDKSRRA